MFGYLEQLWGDAVMYLVTLFKKVLTYSVGLFTPKPDTSPEIIFNDKYTFEDQQSMLEELGYDLNDGHMKNNTPLLKIMCELQERIKLLEEK